jgi:alpha-tubulin suppressor-like RCC1 family protein
MNSRALAVAAFALCACFKPASQECSPQTCPGCCNQNGQCQSGDTVSACGQAGTACRVCETPLNGTSTCAAGSCAFECTQGTHACSGACVSNMSADTCGTRCEACPAPTGATATCDGTTCGVDCGEGRHLCGDACVSDFDLNTCANACTPCLTRPNGITTCQPDAGGCLLKCQPGFRLCSAECRADSVSSCGESCSICTSPDGGVSSCDGGTCSYECRTGRFRCRDGCCSPTRVWMSALTSRSHVRSTSEELYSWGNNPGVTDVLGVGNIMSHRQPIPAPLYGQGVATMSLGTVHTCAVYVDGGTRCIGAGSSGQLGDGQQQRSGVPVEVVGLPDVPTQLALGDTQSLALVNGAVYAWGSMGSVNDAGVAMLSTVAVPYHTDLMTGVSFVAAGLNHFCAVKQQQAWCWGANDEGQLGAGRPTWRSLPRPVEGIDAGVTAVALAEDHTCALAAGQVWCWGGNAYRQVWWGSTERWIDQPFKVIGAGSDVVAIATGLTATCVLKGPVGGRSVMCWGTGALGDGVNISMRAQPATVLNVTGNVEALAGAAGHFCALMNQAVWCWGRGGYVGHGLSSDALTPVPITSP